MIRTSKQLKDKVRNISSGEGRKSQILIRNYMMERFLERCSVSKYRENFILKGGLFIAAVIGLDERATMDMDTTIRKLPLNMKELKNIVEEIMHIKLDDGIYFEIMSVKEIMEGREYPGIRFMLTGHLDKLRQPIKIDISTGDIITPSAIEYSYKLMFEEREIPILSYNIETALAEKLETILDRSTTNTRMRDFYDIYIILRKEKDFDKPILKEAFRRTSQKRGTLEKVFSADDIIDELKVDDIMKEEWNRYKKGNYYVGELQWVDVLRSVMMLKNMITE